MRNIDPSPLTVDAPTALDLFAGAGGLGEGLESAGIRVVTAVELHPQPALTHALNHPHADVFAGDIRELDVGVLEESVRAKTGRSDIDIVVGGPPCQGFSTAGKKDADDPRNDLFRQFVRLVDHFQPRVFLLENVPGFKRMHGGAAFLEASRLFEALGYELQDTIIHAPAYGVPQRRARFVMVGVRPGTTPYRFVWPEPTHRDLSLPQDMLSPDLPPFVTAEEALSDISFLEPGWEAHRHQTPAIFDYGIARRAGVNLLFNHLATRHREKALATFRCIPEGQTIASIPKEHRPKKVTMARLARGRISNAVLALPDDMIHYAHDRIPSVREMARLQSFDDDYVFVGKRTSGFMERRIDVPQYTQVGNAVPPLLGRALGQALVRCLGAAGRDLRDIATRREHHGWIRGSSGYAGYNLDPAAQGVLALFSIAGVQLPLPCRDDEMRVIDAPPTSEWKLNTNPRRGQWVPDTGGAQAVELV